MTKPLLSIFCITYNHEQYISQAIDGFLKQKTDFPIEIIIHDDCSTDSTPQIIQSYVDKFPNLIKPIFQQENQYALGKKITPIVLPICKGKYIAFCEGDDYWITNDKLQKQVEFLESNPDYVFCYTRFNTLDSKTSEITPDKNGKYFVDNKGIDFNFKVFDQGWHIGTQTIVYKKEALLQHNNFFNKHYRDVFLVCDLLTVGKAHCLNDFTAIYRQHDKGIYSSNDELTRVKNGSETYKAIYLVYKDNNYIKSKYIKFNSYYINYLLKNKLYTQAIEAIEEQVTHTEPPSTQKERFFSLIDEHIIFPINQQLQQKNTQLQQKNSQITDINNSLSYKVGRLITLPLRLIASIPEKINLFLNDCRISSDKHKRELIKKGVVFIDKKKIIKDSKKLIPLSDNPNHRKPRLIVSLTSFPDRIPDIFFNLYSLLHQSVKPDILVLWLAEEQFPNKEKDLPKTVLDLNKYGLTINWCKDIKSFKKLIYTLIEFPNDIIVTADDDIYYPYNWLELLYNSYTRNPENIHCHRAHKITFDVNGEMEKYSNWEKRVTAIPPSYLNFFTGAGGVLYPPHSLDKTVLNEELFKQICPTADDIWFWAMAVINNTKIQVVDDNFTKLIYIDPLLEYGITDGMTLGKINYWSENDNQFKNLFSYFEKERSVNFLTDYLKKAQMN